MISSLEIWGKRMIKKGLAVVVILLFIGVAFAPTFSSSVTPSTTITYDGSLSGYVKNTNMDPIDGARVRVYFHETYEEDYTDSSGYYHVTNIPICYCLKNATASKVGYETEWVLLGIAENTIHDFILTTINQPPNPPTDPDPEDEAENVVVDPILSVLVSDPDFEVYINVKFYDASDDGYIGSDVIYTDNTRAYCQWKNLRPCTTYSWYAVAEDYPYHNTTQSDTWNFTTGIENNNPPTVPTINGPTSGSPHQKYYYTFISTDPDDHDVYYEIDWGDGKFDTIGPYTSNVLKNTYHTWDDSGNFTIKARTKDVYGEYSDWAYLEVTMPVDQQSSHPWFTWFLERFPNAFPILRHLFDLE